LHSYAERFANDSLLWSVSSDKQGSGFLYGTMHLKHRAAFYYADKAIRYLETCDAFASEMPLDDLAGIGQNNSFWLPNGTSLQTYLSADKYDKIRKILLKAFSIDLQFFHRFRPFLLTSVIADKVLIPGHEQSLDQFLWDQAATVGKKMGGLETQEEQMEIMEKIPLPLQMRMLKNIARNPNRYRRQIIQMARLYEQGLTQRLYQSSKRQLGGLKRILLYDRNLLMSERMISSLKEQRTFAAVGAAHLFGSRGILRLLKHRGYRVFPVH